jgi:D-hydroxyproline dehydrogenase
LPETEPARLASCVGIKAQCRTLSQIGFNRSFKHLLMEDVFVIGAGIIGCSAALNLAKQGFRVTIVDSSEPGSGCSFGNAGLIAVDHVAPLASPQTVAGLPRMVLQTQGPLRLNARGVPRMTPWLWQFLKQSTESNYTRNTLALASLVTAAKDAWRRLIDSKVIPTTLYRDIGALYVFERPESPDGQRQLFELLERYQVEHRELSANDVRSEFLPSLTKEISHARYIPAMASVTNPQLIVQSVYDAALSAGARFIRTRVDSINLRSNGGVALTCQGNEVTAGKVLISAGALSGELTARLGTNIPLTKERGYHIELDSPSPNELPVPVSFVEAGFTCNPMDKRIRLAGTVELGAGDKPDWRRADMLVSQFSRLFPGAVPKAANRWFGDRPTFPDYLPMIDELPTAKNVYVATGHQHLGLTLGPVTGELVSRMMSGQKPDVNLDAFRASRFVGRSPN